MLVGWHVGWLACWLVGWSGSRSSYVVESGSKAFNLDSQIDLPPKAIAAAAESGMKPDAFFCIELLDQTGICVVPGSGFGQKEGTYHFRTTFLPPESEMDAVIEKLTVFTTKFMNKYA
jgi:aspartate/methionine/tyrosine aminotransferase